MILGRSNSRLWYVVGPNQKRKCNKEPRGSGGKDVCEPSMCTLNKEGQKHSGCFRKSYQSVKVVMFSPLLTTAKSHALNAVFFWAPQYKRNMDILERVQ